jgi:hypothetical protein
MSEKQDKKNLFDAYKRKNKISFISDDVSVENVKISNSLRLSILGNKEQKQYISKIAKNLSLFPRGRKVLIEASKSKMTIIPCKYTAGFASFNNKNNHLYLNSNSNINERSEASLCHEAVHVNQFDKGIVLDPERLDPKSYLMTMCAIEADACAQTGLVAFEKKQKGMPQMWNAYKKDYEKQANAIENNKNKDSQKMLFEAFCAWYDNVSDRRLYEKSYPKKINLIKKASFDKKQSPKDIISKICLDENNQCYFQAPHNILETKAFLSLEEETWEELSAAISKKKKDKKFIAQIAKRKILGDKSNITKNKNYLISNINNRNVR